MAITTHPFTVGQRGDWWYVLYGEMEVGPGWPTSFDARQALALATHAFLIGTGLMLDEWTDSIARAS